MFFPNTLLPVLFVGVALFSGGPLSEPPIPAVPACAVSRVVDGDTVDLICDGAAFRARLTGFDTPETYDPACAAEAALGRLATGRLRQLVGDAALVEADIGGTDRYGRRLVALKLDGQEVSRRLISENLAVPYSGGRRINWCDRLS
jgi:endonuclease YncB( thermonuclease family)